MKKRSIFLLAGLLTVSAAGMATASAFIIQEATAKNTTATVDSVMILDWGTEQAVANIGSLTPGAPQFRTISVKAPVKSTSVTDDAVFTCSVAAKEGNIITGLDVAIATTTWDDSATTAVETLNAENLSYSATITEDITYYLRITINATEFEKYKDNTAGGTFGGTITLSYAKKDVVAA